MYCAKCGTQLPETATRCDKCGEVLKSNVKEFYSYDYLAVEVNNTNAPEVMDCYESLGWEATGSDSYVENRSLKAMLNFKRDRKIKNKEQLIRQQAKLDDAYANIKTLEKKKKEMPNIVSLILGIIGSLILGGGMSLCMVLGGTIPMVCGIIVGVIGIVVCAVNYPIYKKILSKKSAKINPLISKKKEEIATICETAHKYLF